HYVIEVAAACPVTGSLTDDLPRGLMLQPASVTAPAGWTLDARPAPAGASGAGYVGVSGIQPAGGSRGRIEFDAVADASLDCTTSEPNVASYVLTDTVGIATSPPVR